MFVICQNIRSVKMYFYTPYLYTNPHILRMYRNITVYMIVRTSCQSYFIHSLRACLKNAFCKIYVTICGRFCLNEGGVAGYVNRTKAKYTAKWGM